MSKKITEIKNVAIVAPAEDRFLSEMSHVSQYAPMITYIQERYPEIQRATSNFNKSQSQFMDNMLTVSAVTPIRNLRQILAEMKQIRAALGEAYYNIEEKKIEIRERESNRKNITNHFEREKNELQIEKLHYHIHSSMDYVEGAIRKLANYQVQYDSIMEKYNLNGFTEEDFERDEEAYHITRAFQQGMSAARARGGGIDEGNQIYFEQIGINGTVAQIEMNKYLAKEIDVIKLGGEPSHRMQVEWLLEMAKKFRGCSKEFAEFKGQTGNPTPIAFATTDKD
jgi:hypothetical protein